VLDPSLDLRAIGTDEAWENDPVHPSAAAYSRIAAASAKINYRMRALEAESKRRRESVGEGGTKSTVHQLGGKSATEFVVSYFR
jgi:hypothetical protein